MKPLKATKKIQDLDRRISEVNKKIYEAYVGSKIALETPQEYFADVDQSINNFKHSTLQKEMKNFIKNAKDTFNIR